MSTIGDLFGALWEVWKDMYKSMMDVLPKALKFILWLLCGILILPCVFVAGVLFPAWEDWGKEL